MTSPGALSLSARAPGLRPRLTEDENGVPRGAGAARSEAAEETTRWRVGPRPCRRVGHHPARPPGRRRTHHHRVHADHRTCLVHEVVEGLVADRHLACAGGRRGREPHDLAADGVAARPAPAASSPGREPLSSRHPCATVTSATASTTGCKLAREPTSNRAADRCGDSPAQAASDRPSRSLSGAAWARLASEHSLLRPILGAALARARDRLDFAVGPDRAITLRHLRQRTQSSQFQSGRSHGEVYRSAEWNPHRRTAESRLVHPSCHWVRGWDDAPRHARPCSTREAFLLPAVVRRDGERRAGAMTAAVQRSIGVPPRWARGRYAQ